MNERALLQLLKLLPKNQLSMAVGQLTRFKGPRPVLERAIATFAKIYDVDMDEAVVPPGGFQSFNEFFMRELRPGARPIDPDPALLLSPADGKLLSFGRLESDSSGHDARLGTIKDRDYSLRELLGGEPSALLDTQRFLGGQQLTIYLSPRDYHRVHTPIEGRLRGYRYIPGQLYPVNGFAVRNVDDLFVINERMVILLESERFGQVAVIMVGATCVGHISTQFATVETNTGRDAIEEAFRNPPRMDRGQELGVFEMGSTVVMLIEAEGAQALPELHCEMPLRMGQALVRDGH